MLSRCPLDRSLPNGCFSSGRIVRQTRLEFGLGGSNPPLSASQSAISAFSAEKSKIVRMFGHFPRESLTDSRTGISRRRLSSRPTRAAIQTKAAYRPRDGDALGKKSFGDFFVQSCHPQRLTLCTLEVVVPASHDALRIEPASGLHVGNRLPPAIRVGGQIADRMKQPCTIVAVDPIT